MYAEILSSTKNSNCRNIIFLIISIYFCVPVILFAQQEWTLTNGPKGGETIFDIKKDSFGHIYIGTSTGGVFKSTDDGQNWIQKNQGIGNVKVAAIAVHQDNSMLIATPAFWGGGYGGYVFRSDSGAQSWTRIGTFNETIRCVSVAPNNWIYVGTWGGGVYMSTNNGLSWGQYNNALTNLGINAFFFKDDFVFVNTDGGGIYRSSNGGLTWIPINNGLIPNPSGYIYIKAVALNQSGEIYLTNGQNMYKSTDNGNNWVLLSYIPGISNFCFVGDTIFAACSLGVKGVVISTDFGYSWENFGLQGIWCTQVIFTANTFFAGTHGEGLYIKQPETDWNQIFNDGSLPVSTITLTLFGGNKLLAGTEHWGIHISTNFGDDWIKSNLTRGKISQIAVANNGYIFAGHTGIYRSTDDGFSWHIVLPNINLNHLLADRFGNIYAGTANNGLLRSTDYGETWEIFRYLGGFYSHFGEMLRIDDSTLISAHFFANQGPGGQYYYHNQTFRSTDNGNSWLVSLEGTYLRNIVMTKSRIVFASSGSRIYQTTNKGEVWSLLNMSALPQSTVNNMTFNSNDVLFISIGNKFFKSSDLGQNWMQLSTATLPNSDFIAFEDTLLFAASSDGVYKRDQDVLTYVKEMENKINSFALLQNYPNPFNPSTTISWQSPVHSHQTLKVYDVLGREVATLVNEERPAGYYEVTFDASNISSGIYYYQLRAGSFVETKKMILIR